MLKGTHIIHIHEGAAGAETHPEQKPDKHGNREADLVVKSALTADKYANTSNDQDVDLSWTKSDTDLGVDIPGLA